MELLEVQKEADGASQKAILFGLVAIVLAGIFGWLLAHLGGGGPESRAVVVAAQNIDALTKFNRDQLRVVQWPITSVPEDSYDSIDKVVANNQLYIATMAAGEPVLKPKVSDAERGLGISQLVEPNMRAFVVQVSEPAAKAQIVHPGANVDVIATLADQQTRIPVTRTVLQSIKVLAVGDSVDVERVRKEITGDNQPDPHSTIERHRVVTLLVSLADAETLAFATTQGKIDLALRMETDSERVITHGATLSQILGTPAVHDEAAAAAEKAAEAQPALSRPRPAHNVRPHSPAQAPQPAGPVIYKVHH